MQNSIWNVLFLRLWTGSTAAGFATWGLPFLFGLSLIQDAITPEILGALLAVRTIGFLVGVVFGGVIADRTSRRIVVLWSSLIASLGIVLIVFGLTVVGPISVAIILVASGITGLGQGACRPPYQALVPIFVEKSNLQSANAAMSLSVRVTVLLGPTLTSAIAIWIGIEVTFLLLSAIWIISAVVPPWGEPQIEDIEKEKFNVSYIWGDIREGLIEAKHHPWFLAGLAALTAVIATGYSASGVLLPLMSETLYGGSHLLVASMTGYTFGAIIGAIIVSKLRFKPMGWWALGGLAIYGAVPLSLMWGNQFHLVVFAYILAGIGIEIFNVQWFTAMQREIPRDYLARASSLDFLFSYGLAPVGLALIIPLADNFGINSVLAGCATICFIAPLVAAFIPSSREFSSVKKR